MRKKPVLLLLFCSLLLSAAAHLFFLQEWAKGQFMIGPNDGLSQIIPFKMFIYDQYKQGNFFYSWGFGLGGGFYSQLAYYFSTSLFFFFTVCLVGLLELLQIISPPDIFFWAHAAIVASIVRLSVILLVSTFVYQSFNLPVTAAFSGAAVYGLSIMYFRHAVFWEFFADAMLWVPFLVFSIEKIIREGRPVFFIATFSLMLINNFYFAYVNLIFVIIYLLFRWLLPLSKQELPKKKQLLLVVKSGLISFCISAVSFIPAAYGFFNNERPSYQQEIPLFSFDDNLLFSSRFIILPALFSVFLFMRSFYKNRVFAFFACLSFFLVLLHFSPLAASAFNGFSAPQYRWEYILSFSAGGAVAVGLTLLRKVSLYEVITSIIATLFVYGLFGVLQQKLPIASGQLNKLLMFILLLLLITVVAVFVCSWKKNQQAFFLLQAWILLSGVLVVNVYQKYAVYDYSVHQVSSAFLKSDAYNSKEQQQLIEKIKKQEGNSLVRIDWMAKLRNNTPIVQQFNGTSLYSSIFNQELLFFYWHDLQVDMSRESVSRYATLGNRANLHSLLRANYWIREKKKSSQAPYGFVLVDESEHYVVYKNTLPLPFIRTAKHVFSETDLKSASPLDREHAMLTGVVLNRKSSTKLPKEKNHIGTTGIKEVGAFYGNGRLVVTEKIGGIDLIPDPSFSKTGDFYIHLFVKNFEGKGFPLKVNEYRTTRKHNKSIYKTGLNNLVIRVPKKEKISIRVPKGTYELKNIELYEENYQELKTASEKSKNEPLFKWKKNVLTLSFNNQTKEKYMVLPIPYEKGWELRINGDKTPIDQANYAWTGFALKKGINHIQLVYYPPYFRLAFFLTLAGIVSAILFLKKADTNR